MKISGYTRKTDSVLKKHIKLFIRDKHKSDSIFTFGNPLCPIDKRMCNQKGKIKSGSCRDTYSWLFKAGPCRKVEIEHSINITIKEP